LLLLSTASFKHNRIKPFSLFKILFNFSKISNSERFFKFKLGYPLAFSNIKSSNK